MEHEQHETAEVVPAWSRDQEVKYAAGAVETPANSEPVYPAAMRQLDEAAEQAFRESVAGTGPAPEKPASRPTEPQRLTFDCGGGSAVAQGF